MITKMQALINDHLQSISEEIEMEFRFSADALMERLNIDEKTVYGLINELTQSEKDSGRWAKVKINPAQHSILLRFKPFYYGRENVSDRHTDNSENTPDTEK